MAHTSRSSPGTGSEPLKTKVSVTRTYEVSAPLIYCPYCERQTVHTRKVGIWGMYTTCCQCSNVSF